MASFQAKGEDAEMIDWDRTAELRSEIGAEDYSEVVAMFLDEMEEEMVSLRNAPAVEQLEGKLHFLKGSALNLGFGAFAALCQVGETAAATGNFDQINLDDLAKVYDESKAEFLARMPEELAARCA